MTTPRINQKEIINLINQGYTNAYIASEVDCHRNTVSRIRNRPAPRKAKITFPNRQSRDDRILELNNSGISNSEIARLIDCHRNTIARSLNGSNQAVFTNRISPYQRAEIMRLRNLGYNQTYIGEQIGCHRNTVSRTLRSILTDVNGVALPR